MYKFKRKAGIAIPIKYENEEWLDLIKRTLTRYSKVYGSQDTSELNEFFVKTNKNIIIPRFFPIQDYVDCEIVDETFEGETIDIEHNITLRNDLQKRAIDYLSNNESGTIELQPGTGKTVITIYDITQRKKKSIILVYLSDLCKQWKSRFLEHTNLNEEDILIVSSKNFDQMKDKKILIITNQTFISLLKNNPFEFLKELSYANIGIFVSDECHTSIGAKTFSKCSINIPSKVVRGLSATPYRIDGNNDIINYHTGSIFCDESYEGTVTDVYVTFILLDFGLDEPRRKKYLYWGNNFNKPRYLNLMINPKHSPRFHSIIKGLLDKFKDNYNSLVIVERLKLLDLLYNYLETDDKAKFVGNSSLDKLDYKVTFATPKKIRDGIDAPWKELLILTSPIGNIKQMIGRVCREYKDKNKVKIIDIVDIGCKPVKDTLHERKKYYQNNGWLVNYILFDLNLNSKIITEDELSEL